MDDSFAREGELTDIRSYPAWAQDLAGDCAQDRRLVAEHELFRLMRDGELAPGQVITFLASVWPVIEQFPQYMALNLLKVQLGRARGHSEARRYLIRNIRVEQNHADHWIEWARASGLSTDDLLQAEVTVEANALSHWCWHTCERDSLAAGMAATNYAIEGVTGDWSALVCSTDTYENSFPANVRAKAMKWLKLHAKYDDTHPWEALEIICTLLGRQPTRRYYELVRSRVLTSYRYMRLTLDQCLESRMTPLRPAPEADRNYPAHCERA
ncbi:MAG TPA: iron-containing redox enzyme family protein [Burkholderiaceae bacterium]